MCAPQSGPLRDVHGVIQRRGRKETGGQEDKGGNQKERDRSVISNRTASNQFPKFSPLSGTHRNSDSWIEKRRGREETQPGGEKGESKGGESSQASNLTPK